MTRLVRVTTRARCRLLGLDKSRSSWLASSRPISSLASNSSASSKSRILACRPSNYRPSYYTCPITICSQCSFVTTHRRIHSHAGQPTEQERIEIEKSIQEYAAEPQRPISLQGLVKFANLVPVPDSVLLENAKDVIHDISVRLAHRLDALRNLDYLIVLNPNISQIYSLYYNSFKVISTTPPPQTIEENSEFVEVLENLVQTHSNTIPTLAKGFFEARKYISTEQSSEILDRHLRARIGTRLLAEHHIALTHPYGDNFIGTIQKDCRPADILRECATFVGDICDLKYGIVPHLQIDQGENVQLAYVPVHLEYIFTELLKNAFRAVIENGTVAHHHSNPDTASPVTATIIRTGQGVMVRIRDRGGGIPPELQSSVMDFAYSTYEDNEGTGFATLNAPPGGGSSIAGLGYGLPLSKAYAEFFGGRLQIQSYHGWGTDIYVTLKSPVNLYVGHGPGQTAIHGSYSMTDYTM